jgi:Zn-dependent membrane protease YugP
MQYESNYMPIRLRNAILPVASIGSHAAPWIVILGLFMGSYNLAMIGVVLFGAMLVFQVVTLPVEFNASSRALRMLEEGNYITYEESDGAKKVLNAAAMTYVWAAVASLVSFLRLLALANRSRR